MLRPTTRRTLRALILGAKAHCPLADPRLEVLRAISASLARGAGAIGRELMAAAQDVGWSIGDLGKAFPGVPMPLP
ncbi:hypothetical protein ATB93_14925 [Sphingomonas sp. WG]|nr:hypothetical protein ATB93_14925 [Sphingomonas sp. WG]